MKTEKNKIVFISVVVIILIFITAYSAMLWTGEEDTTDQLKQPSVPALTEEKETYDSKIEALDDLKEDRESNVPSIYSEKLLDSLGIYDPALEISEKERALDSIYHLGRIDYDRGSYREDPAPPPTARFHEESLAEPGISPKDLRREHEAFFSPIPSRKPPVQSNTDNELKIIAEVNGAQKLRTGDRVELTLVHDVTVGSRHFSKNSLIYGFVKFQPNRVLIGITHIDHVPVNLRAFDLQDGREGVYVRNSFRSEATREVLDDVIQDVNIAGLPQVGGVKNIFRRNNRNLKVTITDQYKLILKP